MGMTDRNQPKRADSSDSQYSIMEFMREFPDDAACLEWLWRNRYSADGVHANCPHCDRQRVFRKYETKQQRQSWTCTGCGLHIHPTAGTIFHKSSTSLQLWFYAMYLMTSTRCGISAKQIERELGVTYKTAWRMCKLIRHELMEQDTTRLDGQVEADETLIGGKPRVGKPMSRAAHLDRHAKVAGVVERGGRVIASVTKFRPDARQHVVEHVLPSAVLFTDEYGPYQSVGGRFQRHHRINHSEKVYVSGDVHTQTIEGFWSLVKNGIRGVYHSVSHKHLQDYLNEYAWRYNHRFDTVPMFKTIIGNSTRELRSGPTGPVPARPRGLSYRPL
ncbi:MAG: IS1595 family transposase [Actinomycetota bacterium]|nr:IS1595 family transposase [Actinomycetota bacterium]